MYLADLVSGVLGLVDVYVQWLVVRRFFAVSSLPQAEAYTLFSRELQLFSRELQAGSVLMLVKDSSLATRQVILWRNILTGLGYIQDKRLAHMMRLLNELRRHPG